MRFHILCAVLLAVVACGGDSTSPDGSTSGNSPNSPANLSGTWTGTIGQAGQANPVTLSWRATHNGSSISGPITATITETGQSLTITGTLSGTIGSNGVALTLTFPAGTFTATGAPSTCAMTGAGNTTLATTNNITTVTGSMTLTWGASCVGTIADKATETDQLTLTKH